VWSAYFRMSMESAKGPAAVPFFCLLRDQHRVSADKMVTGVGVEVDLVRARSVVVGQVMHRG
jgi:hypothetical protein